MTPVYDIYSRVTTVIEDTKMMKLSDEEIEFIFEKYIETAIVLFKELNYKYRPIIIENEFGEKFIKKSILNGSDSGEDLDLEEQVILAHGIILSWHNAQILRDRFLKQNMNTKDFNQLSNATMLSNNENLHDRLYKDFVKMRRKYKSRFSGYDDLS